MPLGWPLHIDGAVKQRCIHRTTTLQKLNDLLGVLVAQLVWRHSCVADRLPVVVRFPAGPRVSLKTVDPLKGNGLGTKFTPRHNERPRNDRRWPPHHTANLTPRRLGMTGQRNFNVTGSRPQGDHLKATSR